MAIIHQRSHCSQARKELTFPALSIGSSSSCFAAFAFPLPLAVSDALGVDFDVEAGFEKTLAGGADLTGGLDFATGFCGLDS